MPPPSRGLCESPTRWPLHTVGLCVPPSSRGLGKAPGWASWELPSGTALCQDLDAQRRQAPPTPSFQREGLGLGPSRWCQRWVGRRPRGLRGGGRSQSRGLPEPGAAGSQPECPGPRRFLGEGFSPVAPSSSQTPRGSRTRPRWRRCGRRCMRPWRPTANTSTPSSQGGEPRPRPCQDLGVSGAACPPGQDTH